MTSKALIILTYNEIDGSKEVYSKIPLDIFDEVIVIDGGSEDGTTEFWMEKNHKVVRQDKPGRGSAFVLGHHLTESEIMIFFSPDGNEDPNDIEEIINELENGADLVVATRFGKGGKSEDAGFIRTIGNKMFTLAIRIFFGINTTDAVNGFRGIWRNKFEKLKLPNSKFEIEFQMTVRAGKLNYNLVEIPTFEAERIGGHSKAGTVPVGWAYSKLFIKELLIQKKFLTNDFDNDPGNFQILN